MHFKEPKKVGGGKKNVNDFAVFSNIFIDTISFAWREKADSNIENSRRLDKVSAVLNVSSFVPRDTHHHSAASLFSIHSLSKIYLSMINIF